jgi:transcriptional regulator with XRE-family HTH domain
MLKVFVRQSNLERALIRKNYTHARLAEKIGVSRNYISSIFTGKREPSADVRQRILTVLKGYKFDDLFIIEENHDGQGHE